MMRFDFDMFWFLLFLLSNAHLRCSFGDTIIFLILVFLDLCSCCFVFRAFQELAIISGVSVYIILLQIDRYKVQAAGIGVNYRRASNDGHKQVCIVYSYHCC